jgi:hypothetical protein
MFLRVIVVIESLACGVRVQNGYTNHR